MNGGHDAALTWVAALAAWLNRGVLPVAGMLMAWNEGVFNKGRYVGNSDDGAVFMMAHDWLVPFIHSEKAAAPAGSLLAVNTG